MSRIVAIFGATGSSVLEALLKDGTFTPRAISRDPESEAAQKLKARGVEVVKGDTADKASLVNALRGSEGVFAVCGFVPHAPKCFDHSKPSEITHGKNIVDAAKETGVKFFIFSSVPGLTKLTKGRFTQVSLYDDKAVIEEYLQASGLPNASLHLGAFTENLWTQRNMKPSPTGSGFVITIPKYTPTAQQAFSWIGHDVGEAALALFKSYTDSSKNISGNVYPVVTARMTFPAFAALISKTLGVEVTFNSIPTTGHPAYDGMFEAQAAYDGFYTETPVPNPALVALGAKFGTIEEFVETEVKKHFG
ncbi:NAD(P)-binding protein [Mycena polygramma]|nr:NAD(P)-binding protein [Mycena polygramma]